MQKHIMPVLSSFFGVIIFILLGTNIAYRTNTIPTLKDEFQKEKEISQRREEDKNDYITNLQKELDIAIEKQYKAEEKLKEKLAIEERIAQEKARKEQEARIAAEQAVAAETARIAAEKEKSSSKKSKAS